MLSPDADKYATRMALMGITSNTPARLSLQRSHHTGNTVSIRVEGEWMQKWSTTKQATYYKNTVTHAISWSLPAGTVVRQEIDIDATAEDGEIFALKGTADCAGSEADEDEQSGGEESSSSEDEGGAGESGDEPEDSETELEDEAKSVTSASSTSSSQGSSIGRDSVNDMAKYRESLRLSVSPAAMQSSHESRAFESPLLSLPPSEPPHCVVAAVQSPQAAPQPSVDLVEMQIMHTAISPMQSGGLAAQPGERDEANDAYLRAEVGARLIECGGSAIDLLFKLCENTPDCPVSFDSKVPGVWVAGMRQAYIEHAKLIDTLIRHCPYMDINGRVNDDGFSAAFCAAKNLQEGGDGGFFELLNQVYSNHCLAVLVYHGAKFIHPARAKLTSSQRLFVYCYIFFGAGLYVMCFMLVTTYSKSVRFAINTSCDTMYGVVLQPYGVILLNIIFFKAFQSTFTIVIEFVMYLFFLGHHGKMTEIYDAARIDLGGGANEEEKKMRHMYVMQQYISAWKSDYRYRGADATLQTPYLFLYFQLASSFVAFVLVCINIHAESQVLTQWQQYTKLYGILTNSSMPMTFYSILRMAVDKPYGDGRSERMKDLYGVWATGAFYFVLLAVVFFTHILPAVILYCWLILLVVLSVGCAVALCWGLYFPAWGLTRVASNLSQLFGNVIAPVRTSRRASLHKISNPYDDTPAIEFLVEIGSEVLQRFAFVFLFQTLFNYAALVYEQPIPMSPAQYMGIITRDYHLRSQTVCYFSQIAQSSSTGFIVLFSWI